MSQIHKGTLTHQVLRTGLSWSSAHLACIRSCTIKTRCGGGAHSNPSVREEAGGFGVQVILVTLQVQGQPALHKNLSQKEKMGLGWGVR